MSHSYSNNYVHAVYSTKDRKDSIPTEFEKRLYPFIASVAHGNKIPLIAAGGMPNHSHLLFLLPATYRWHPQSTSSKQTRRDSHTNMASHFNGRTGMGPLA
jgi:REP element-mobilizing transposase RayT